MTATVAALASATMYVIMWLRSIRTIRSVRCCTTIHAVVFVSVVDVVVIWTR